MRLVIAGPGALGCLIASRLAEAAATTGDSICILDHDVRRAKQIDSNGLLYEKSNSWKRYPLSASAHPDQIGRADVLFVCVKSYDLKTVLDHCRSLLVAGTLVIFMQNGIAHLQLQDQMGAATVAYGCTSEGATSLGSGHVRHAGAGQTFLGFLDKPGTKAEILLAKTVDLLKTGGLVASVSDGIVTRLWAKLFVNAGINALTAIHDCLNGDLLAIPKAQEEMQEAVAEAERLAVAKGIVVENDPYQITVEVCRATAANISSMRQDVLKKKKTEIDAINGAVVQEAGRLGIPVPVNTSLVRRIKSIEAGYGQQEKKAVL